MEESILISFKGGQVLLEGEGFTGRSCREAVEKAAQMLRMTESKPPELKPEYYQAEPKIREATHERS